MKKRTTLFKAFLALLFLFGNLIASAQPSELWNVTPDWINNGTLQYNYRGIAYNAGNNHLYVAGNEGGAAVAADNKIKVLDASTGEVLKTLTLEPLSLADMGYGIKDVEVSSDGGIFAIITTQNYYHPLKLFYWANEDAQPVKLWEVEHYTHSNDFSGGFSVKGDFSKEALIIIPIHNVDSVYYFETQNSNLGNVNRLKIAVSAAGGTYAHAHAIGTKIADGFWYNNSVLQKPTLLDGTGNIVGAIDAGLFSGTTGGVKQFMAGDKTYVSVSNAGSIKIIDITDAASDFSDVDASNIVTSIAGTASPASTINGYGQEECVVGYGDGGYVVYSLSGYRYIKALATEVAPFAKELLLTGFAMVDSLAQVSYTYVDVNGDEEGESTFKWFVSDDDQGTNKTQFATTAEITVSNAYVDKYLSFSVLPVALTGTASYTGNEVESAYFGPVVKAATKPVASNLAITGDPEVYGLLAGSYDFNDADGDEEGETIIKWYRADDAAGTNAIEVANDTLKYAIAPADADKYLIFSVTPVSISTNYAIGDSVAVVSSIVIFPAFIPEASNLTISGIEEVSRVLTGTYSYSDLNFDIEGASVLTWYQADAVDGTKTVVANDTNRYELAATDEGKYIFFGVKPVTVDAEEGVEVFDTTGVIAPKPAESAPIAQDVMVHGNPEVGALISGSYTYFDYTGDLEGATTFKWYIADDAAGTNATEIAGATTKTILIEEAQLGKYIIFEVTPVALSGGLLTGDAVQDTTTEATIASTMTESSLDLMWAGTDLLGSIPDYFDGSVRCLAVGSGDHMYVASRENTATIHILNKANGIKVGELDASGITAEGSLAGVYAINDIEVSEDGQILAAPTVNESSFWIYKWENETAQPTVYAQADLNALGLEGKRFGDKFSVVGDLTGNAVILAPVTSASSTYTDVLRWRITEGVLGEVEHFELQGINWGTGNNAELTAYSADISAKMLLESRSNARYIFDGSANVLTPYGLPEGTIKVKQTLGSDVFKYKGNTYAAYITRYDRGSAIRGARILIQDLNTLQFVDSSDYFTHEQVVTDYYGDVDVVVEGEYYYVYASQISKGLGVFRGEAYPPLFVSAQTTWEGDKLSVEFTKSLDVNSVTPTTANWTVKADGTVVEVSALTCEENIVTVNLGVNIAEGQAVTLSYDGEGGVVATDGMPLGAFGPENVLNIVGAEAPVASNVDFTGDMAVGSQLTGTYTYTDSESDAEGASKYQWYYASDVDGTDKLKIIGETATTYTVTADVQDKYIAFEVTPVALTGGDDYLVGEPVMSAFKLITDINDDLMQQIAVYPNPVKDQLTISGAENITSVQVYDYTGRLVMSQENNAGSIMTMSVSELNAGVYMIQLQDANGQMAVKRIVKN